MTDLVVIVEENPVNLVFDDTAMNVIIEESGLTVSVPQEVTQVTLTNQDVVILTVGEQGPPGVAGSGSGEIPTADQIIATIDGGTIDVQTELQNDRTNIGAVGAQVQEMIEQTLPNMIDIRFGTYVLQDGVVILQPAAPTSEFELVNKAYVDAQAGTGFGWPFPASTTAPSNPQVGDIWLDLN